MPTRFTLLAALIVMVSGLLSAQQNRFIDPIFEVATPVVDTYAVNIDVFELQRAQGGDPNAQVPRPLQMDVYMPVDDDAARRPVVVVLPTGNFLPQYVNQGLYGTRRDSAVVEIAKRVTAMGYVGITADYRGGWNPRGNEAVRTSTLLQAAYRGGQDAHALARYLRRTVVEGGNPYGIDTSRIVFWGLGTGGYVTMTHAFLDRVEEVLADERFYDENDQPYVDITVNADPQGLLSTQFAPGVPSNIPNHVGYSSDVAMSINANGALGDIDWIEGKPNEPLTIGFHAVADIFAPFSYGDVVVPTTEDLVIGCVAGTEQILETTNANGNNDAMADANATDLPDIFSPLSEAINQINAGFQTQTLTLMNPAPCPFQDFDPTYELSHDNMYPWLNQGFGAPYNWVDPVQARAQIEFFNSQGGNLNADIALGGEQATNPNAFNGAAAKLVIDTMIAFFVPRAYIGMDLEELVSNEEVLVPSNVGLSLSPNPAADGFTLRTGEAFPMRQISIYDLNGRLVSERTGLSTTATRVDRGTLPNGTYVVRIRVDEGVVATKVILR